MSTPVPSSNPARIVRRGTMSMCQENSSAPLGAVRIQRLNWGSAPKTPASARMRGADHRRAALALGLERGGGIAGHDAELER